MKKYIIDTDLDPKLPEWATLESHKKMGKVEWEPKNFELYFSPEQEKGYINGNKLYEKIKDTAVMNVNVAQFLVDHPKLYPKEWKGKYVYFWGTLVRDRDGDLHVPYLFEFGVEVCLGWGWTDYVWYGRSPALRFASSTLNSESKTSSPLSLDLENRVLALEQKLEKWEKAVKIAIS